MNAFSTYLWKEWREQRATLMLLAAVLPAGVAVVIATLPRSAAGDALTFQCVVASALAATLLAVGADLLARERDVGLRFLERHPAGLATAFRAKLTFLASALGGAMVFGVTLASAAAWLRAGALPDLELGWNSALPMGAFVVLALWAFAVSAWMPSSALTVPATALLLAVLGWPALLALAGAQGFRPTEAQTWLFVALCLLGAPASAWAAFVCASRAGGTRRAAALAGLAVAAVAFAPSWGWAALRVHAARHATYEIASAWVGTNGRFALLSLRRPRVLFDEELLRSALRLDLADGTWHYLGTQDSSWLESPEEPRHVRVAPPSPRQEALRLVVADAATSSESFVDPLVGVELEGAPAPSAADVSYEDFGLLQAPQTWTVSRAGLGHCLTYREKGSTVLRQRYLAPDGQVVEDDPARNAGAAQRWLIGRGRWISIDRNGVGLFDPVSGDTERLGGLTRNDRIGPLLDDGRVVLLSNGRPWILDLDSGERQPIELGQGDNLRIDFIQSVAGDLACIPAGGPGLVVIFDGRTSRLGWLDVSAATLRTGPSCGDLHLSVLWSDGPRAVVLEGRQRIALHDAELDSRRVILDVAELR